ncbi:MAG: citrate lyase, alpha subunit, partial [Firmicutes bacterium]|nr:citrate lyase, alpha subunit [Bacillota bacterium]
IGKPKALALSEDDKDITAIIEYRDGTLLDVIRKPF